MATEKINFKIELCSDYWDKPPIAEIWLNDRQVMVPTKIKNSRKDPYKFEFEADLVDGQEHNLVIKRGGKFNKQCVVDDNGKIIKDQTLTISHLEIDDIEMGTMMLSAVYRPEYPQPWAALKEKETGEKLPLEVTNTLDLGHNGTWTYTFTSPFYLWLLEKIY